MGGAPFGKNSLHSLLTNRLYIGKITYRDEVYEGQHDAIVDTEIFELVQKQLRSNRINVGDRVRGRSAGRPFPSRRPWAVRTVCACGR